VLIWK